MRDVWFEVTDPIGQVKANALVQSEALRKLAARRNFVGTDEAVIYHRFKREIETRALYKLKRRAIEMDGTILVGAVDLDI